MRKTSQIVLASSLRLTRENRQFLLGVKMTLNFVKQELAAAKPQLQKWENYHPDANVYAYSTTISWQYAQERPYKKDVIKGERRMMAPHVIHFFFRRIAHSFAYMQKCFPSLQV